MQLTDVLAAFRRGLPARRLVAFHFVNHAFIRQSGRARLSPDGVSVRVIAMVVRVQDMRDLPATLCRLGQHRPGYRRVDDADTAALGLARQPHVIVVRNRNTDDV